MKVEILLQFDMLMELLGRFKLCRLSFEIKLFDDKFVKIGSIFYQNNFFIHFDRILFCLS